MVRYRWVTAVSSIPRYSARSLTEIRHIRPTLTPRSSPRSMRLSTVRRSTLTISAVSATVRKIFPVCSSMCLPYSRFLWTQRKCGQGGRPRNGPGGWLTRRSAADGPTSGRGASGSVTGSTRRRTSTSRRGSPTTAPAGPPRPASARSRTSPTCTAGPDVKGSRPRTRQNSPGRPGSHGAYRDRHRPTRSRGPCRTATSWTAAPWPSCTTGGSDAARSPRCAGATSTWAPARCTSSARATRPGWCGSTGSSHRGSPSSTGPSLTPRSSRAEGAGPSDAPRSVDGYPPISSAPSPGTSSVTASRPRCSTPAVTSPSFRRSSATRTWPPPRAMPRCHRTGSAKER